MEGVARATGRMAAMELPPGRPCATLALSGLLVIASGSCQLPVETIETTELGRLHWNIGELEVETVLLLEDGVPAHQTTVSNTGEVDLWWTGLDVYGHRVFGSSPEGGWGSAGGNACTSSRALPEIRNGSVQMRPEETRSYRHVFSDFPPSPRRETVRSWALTGKTALPASQPFSDWPPFQLRFRLNWSRDGGCSVETELIR